MSMLARPGFLKISGLKAMSCFLLGVSLWGQPVEAASEADKKPAAPTEIVIQARRLPAFKGDKVFGSLDLSQDDIARSSSLDASLNLAAQALLFRRTSSLSANPTIQGISLRAIGPSGAGRALVTLDGVPQNDPFGGWVIWAAIPQEAIARIDVIRGAGGGAYGAGALTGVIEMAVRPYSRQGLFSVLEWNRLGGHSLAIGNDLSLGDYGHIGFDLSDQSRKGDVPVRGAQRGAADTPTVGRDRSLLGHWSAKTCPLGLCGEVSALLSSYESRRDTGLSGASALASGHQLSFTFARQPTLQDNGFQLQLWHRRSALSNTSVSVQPGRNATALADNQFATPATGDGLNLALRSQTEGAEWEWGLDGRLSEGSAYADYKYSNGIATRERQAGGASSLLGLYSVATLDFDRTTLSGAARLDSWHTFQAHRIETDLAHGAVVLDLHPQGRTVSVITGRLGIAYKLSPVTTLRAVTYSGFRPPSLNELYRPFRVGNDVTEANANLLPETLTGAELGVNLRSSKSSNSWLIDADLFQNVLYHPVSNITLGLGPATFPIAGFIPAGGSLRERENLDRIEAYGLETHAFVSLDERTRLTGSATLTHARVSSALLPQLNGKIPAEAPAYSLTLGLMRHLKCLSLSADVTFEGRTFDDDLNLLPLKSYSRLQLQASYALSRQVSLQLKVDNATNSAIQITHSGDGTLGFDNSRAVSLALIYRQQP